VNPAIKVVQFYVDGPLTKPASPTYERVPHRWQDLRHARAAAERYDARAGQPGSHRIWKGLGDRHGWARIEERDYRIGGAA
jgi:hypothetical protein